MGVLREYDPKKFQMVWGGHLFNELDANFFSVQQDAPNYSIVQGIDGDAAKVRSKYRGGSITVGLMQSSLSNEFLSGMSFLDQVSGVVNLPFLAKEKGRFGNMVFAPSCFVEAMPDLVMSNGLTTRNWVFRTDNLIQFIGSQNKAGVYDDTGLRNPFPEIQESLWNLRGDITKII